MWLHTLITHTHSTHSLTHFTHTLTHSTHTHTHSLHTHTHSLHTHTPHTHSLHTHTLHTHHMVHPPSDSSELFATSSRGDVRVWHTGTGKELLRLVVPNLSCHALDITPDGGAILTGTHTHSTCILVHSTIVLFFLLSLAWDDGKIRAFYPESGKPMYTIHDAHNKVCMKGGVGGGCWRGGGVGRGFRHDHSLCRV